MWPVNRVLMGPRPASADPSALWNRGWGGSGCVKHSQKRPPAQAWWVVRGSRVDSVVARPVQEYPARPASQVLRLGMSEPDTGAAYAAERKIKADALAAAAAILEGHFDAVVMIGTWQTEAGGTAALSENSGNYYAQIGLMKYHLDNRTEMACEDARESRRED